MEWNAVSSASSYNLYWSTNPGVATASANKIDNVSPPYSHSGLADNTTYYYVVTAQNATGESELSNEVSATTLPPIPQAPVISRTSSGNTSVSIEWSKVPLADSYTLYWATNSGAGKSGTAISNVSSPYTHNGLSNGTTYYYVLSASNSTGESEASLEVSATPADSTPPPVAPTNLAVSSADGQLTLTWAPVTDAETYTVYWSTTMGVGVNGTPVNNASSPTTFAATNGEEYFFVITASNASGEGQASLEVSAIPLNPTAVPAAPNAISATAGDGEIIINWDRVENADSYTVYWSSQSGSGSAGKIVAGTQPPVLHSGLANGSDYYYVVVANNANGSSSVSSEIMATPRKKMHVTALSKAALLQWNIDSSASYNIYYSSVDGFSPDNVTSYADGAMISNVASPYTVSGLSNGKNYYFVLEEIGATTLRSQQQYARPNNLGFNGYIHTSAIDSNARTYLGGEFDKVGATLSDAIILGTQKGRSQQYPFPEVYGEILSSVADNQGGWYIGGNFNMIDGSPRNYIAHILADGSLDTNWNPDVNGAVNTLVLLNNSLYIGGDFTQINGTTRNYLAAFTGTGLSNWAPAANGSVKTLYGMGNRLYIGGAFTEINAITRNHAALVGSDGSLQEWAPNFNDAVNSFAVSGNTIYAGGIFTQVNGETRNRLAAIDVNGALGSWSPRSDGVVTSLFIDHGVVYIGGEFVRVYGNGSYSALRIGGIDFHGDGVWSPLHIPDKPVRSIVVSRNIVYYAGDFTEVVSAQPTYQSNAQLNDTWSAELKINSSPRPNATSIAVQGDQILVGGKLAIQGGATRTSLAAIEADGSLSDWAPTLGRDLSNPIVFKLLADGTSIYVGGDFSSINGISRISLASIDNAGNLLAWNPVLEKSDRIYAMAISNGIVYFAGTFIRVNGNLRFSLAAVDSSGVLQDWDPRSGIISISPDGSQIIVQRAAGIYCMEISGNTVYIGGSFTYISGTYRSGLAAIGTDGVLSNWNPDMRYVAGNVVHDLAVVNNTLYATGHFDMIGGLARNNLAAIGTDGVLRDWAPALAKLPGNANPANAVGSSLALSGNTLYLGGFFDTVDGLARGNGAAFDLTGSLLNWNPSAFGSVSSLSISGGEIRMSGGFNQVGAIKRNNYAVVDSSGQIVQ